MKKAPLIVANWKMNFIQSEAEIFFSDIINFASTAELVICPAFTLLNSAMKILKNTKIKYGAQDISSNSLDFGSFTGEISAEMIKNLGCSYVIIGHSERRKYHHESSEIVKIKIKNAHQKEIHTIVCVGEDIKVREAGKTFAFIEKQLVDSLPDSVTEKNTIIAYEPVWAIGTGKSADSDEIFEIINFIRKKIEKNVKIIYGGSVNKINIKNILSSGGADGALVGGASLVLEQFKEILNNIEK